MYFATKLVIEMNKIGKSLGFKMCVLFSDQNLEENLYKRMGCKLVGKFSEISLRVLIPGLNFNFFSPSFNKTPIFFCFSSSEMEVIVLPSIFLMIEYPFFKVLSTFKFSNLLWRKERDDFFCSSK